MNLETMWRRKYKYFVCALMLLCVYNFFGVGDYMYARSFQDFAYPLNIDLKPIIDEVLQGKKPSVQPINYYPYKFLTNSGKCNTLEKLDLFIVVKSAMNHFGHRQAIRKTYGQEDLIPGRIVKTLFFLGVDNPPKSKLQKMIDKEIEQYKDIVQINFHDNYYNNTIKTMMSFRWVFQHCSTADFYLFTDDDMYISVNNLLDYVHERNEIDGNEIPVDNDVEKRDRHMFAGYVFDSSPQRFKTSKWRVSLDEYPWDRWPAYVTAGAYIVSNLSMKTMYIGSYFVKHFRFDDIYLGIVAKKVGIEPTHCPGMYFYKKKYSKEGYRKVIASHGYSDHEELIRVWTEQNIQPD
ncbi:beta-1,3-galactosyltransferase brn [Pectinophora gossypiella]|uniref:beta-1,3-galactosyltransferase brn n=1 Tax=Pectinophora gossypiella TaxID=13191 RepID=UPI00214E7353|nr:beta-1,3-galactosyltransferase brn [Pectinophora gossypiella]